LSELPLTGQSAGKWDEAGSYLSLAALALLVVTTSLAIAIGWPPAVNAVLGPLLVALLFAGIALRFLGLAKFRAEARAGYSTLQDIPGLDLRDATSGRIIRPANEPVAEWSRVTWFRTARRFDRYKRSS
jgi:hypothetical protein